MRFVVDVMLGRLTKWLRSMGFDTRYQSFKPISPIEELAVHGWIPLTRHLKAAETLECVLIHNNQVGRQLAQLEREFHISADRKPWFSRCLLCNVPLEKASSESDRENIPEYVLHQNILKIRFCPVCGRYYWPGSHRERMAKQLEIWGFAKPFS